MSPGRRRWRPVLGCTCRPSLLLTTLATGSEYNLQSVPSNNSFVKLTECICLFSVKLGFNFFFVRIAWWRMNLNYNCNHGTELDVAVWCESYFCSFNCFSQAAALARSRFNGATPFPHAAAAQTVTLQGTIESRKVSHYPCDMLYMWHRLITPAMDCITPAVARECGSEDAEELESSGLASRLERYSISTDYICRDNMDGNTELFNFAYYYRDMRS